MSMLDVGANSISAYATRASDLGRDSRFEAVSSVISQVRDNAGQSTQDIERVKELSREFESVFLELMLGSMRKTVPKNGLISGGNGEEIYRSMLDSEYAKSMANQGLTGIAESLQSELLRTMGVIHSDAGDRLTDDGQKALQHYQKVAGQGLRGK